MRENNGIVKFAILLLAVTMAAVIMGYIGDSLGIRVKEEDLIMTKKNIESLEVLYKEDDVFTIGKTTDKGIFNSKEYYFLNEILEDGGKKALRTPINTTTIYNTLNADEQAYAEIYEAGLTIRKVYLYVPEKYNLFMDSN